MIPGFCDFTPNPKPWLVGGSAVNWWGSGAQNVWGHWRHWEHFGVISGSFLGHFRDILGTFQGHFEDISGTFQGHFGDSNTGWLQQDRKGTPAPKNNLREEENVGESQGEGVLPRAGGQSQRGQGPGPPQRGQSQTPWGCDTPTLREKPQRSF